MEKRRAEGAVRARVGKMYHHDTLIAKYVSDNWTCLEDRCKTMKEWMTRTEDAREQILKAGNLQEDPMKVGIGFLEKTKVDKRKEERKAPT